MQAAPQIEQAPDAAPHVADRFAENEPAVAQPDVQARHLRKSIDNRPILSEINLEIRRGEYVGFLGANGAGKSTLLKVLATLIPPTAGELKIFGHSADRSSSPAIRARIGMVGHHPMLYRDLSARENLEFFGKLYSLGNARERAIEILEYVGLADRADDPVKAFSRGMIQRVSIARALLHTPELLLADEPFAGLDAPSVRMLEELLAQLHHEGTTIILVNHDIRQSLVLTERVVVLRKGRIVIEGDSAGLDAEDVLREVSRR